MIVTTWATVLAKSFQGVWFGLLSFVPSLVLAIVIFVLGWVVAAALAKVITHAVRAVKLDAALKPTGIEAVLHRAGFTLDSGLFIGQFVKWFLIVVVLTASFEALGLYQVNDFIQTIVLGFLPQVIVAVLILLVSAVIADVVKKTVFASAKAAGLTSASLLASIAKWAIWIFAVLAALVQLNIAAALFQTLFTGFVIALALALGLAFGLGGQQAAAELIEKVKQDIK